MFTLMPMRGRALSTFNAAAKMLILILIAELLSLRRDIGIEYAPVCAGGRNVSAR
jgi:hypothetical protein